LIVGLIYFFSGDIAYPPPKHLEHICYVLKRHPKWYFAARHVRKKWGVLISTQMAFIYKESHFRSEAKPKREKLFGFIPWKRPTSAKGYAQAIDNTWQVYLRETQQRGARRDDFTTSLDFIGWYVNHMHRHLGIPKNNVYALYLAYHEGPSGYLRRSYRKQPYLMHIARKVQARANRYRQQLLACEQTLSKKHWWRFW